MRKESMKRLLCSAFVTLSPQSAFAQDGGIVPPLPGTIEPGKEAGQQSDSAEVANGDIVVTATRRDERLQQVPISITALGGDQLGRSGIANTRELTQAVPALNYRSAGLVSQPIIRGVGSRGTSPGDESNVAIYVDGVYLAAPSAGNFDLLNVERVEVLRGPQGTLFGRNATGGLINIITTPPSNEASTKLQLRMADSTSVPCKFTPLAGLVAALPSI